MEMLTEDEAYLAMFAYLEYRWNIIRSPDLANSLSDMSLLLDGCSADLAIKHEWQEAVKLVKEGKVGASQKPR
jgi:hypothetical protein